MGVGIEFSAGIYQVEFGNIALEILCNEADVAFLLFEVLFGFEGELEGVAVVGQFAVDELPLVVNSINGEAFCRRSVECASLGEGLGSFGSDRGRGKDWDM